MTKKKDLRKVKLSKFDDGSGEFITNGYFHEWANQALLNDNGEAMNNKYAIVELEDGIVKKVEISRIKFVDNF